ncbi:MAG: sigma 54-interacting transcriptional regulator [Myxococcota bacterium]
MDATFARFVLGSMSAGIIAIDTDGAVVSINAEAQRVLGCPQGDLSQAVGRDCRAVIDAQPAVARMLIGTLEAGAAPLRAELVLAPLGGRPSGTIGFTLSPVRDLEGCLRGATLMFRRMTGPRQGHAAPDVAEEIVCRSPALRSVLDLARRVAPTRSTVLISGETGTGKELIAGLIHTASPRARRPLVKVNCAALPETLLESELFGHERGAFTGADRQRVGRFEEASGGTLFLDEIGDMSAATQAKLLRVLENQEFHRLGGTVILRTDARIVSATNQDLEAKIRTGRFREDLFFRLNVIRIHLAPLRERPEDLAALAQHMLRRSARELQRPVRDFSRPALERIHAHHWPGNVRELQNAIERAVLMAEGPAIAAEDLSLFANSPDDPGAWRPELPPEGVSLPEVERRLVLEALRRAGHVQKDAARRLGVSRRKLNYMIGRMGITHASWRRNRSAMAPRRRTRRAGAAGRRCPPP